MVRHAIEKRLSAAGVTAQEFGVLFFPLRSKAIDVLDRLKDNHSAKFITDADAYAEQVLAHTTIPKDAKVAVIGAAAYAYMKALDHTCGTRSAVSSISAALEVLVRAQ